MTRRRFVVLDRDGTLIVERHHLSDPLQVELIPGAASGLRQLNEMGFGLVVITNQSAVGRGLLDQPRLDLIHQRMCELLKAEEVQLSAIYSCPHVPEDDCLCRKPKPGLIELAAEELDFDPQACFVVGDKACDIELGRRVGATTFLVRTGYGVQVADTSTIAPDYVVDDLRGAAQVIRCLPPAADRPYDRVQAHMLGSAEVKREVAEKCANSILAAARLIVGTFRMGGKVLLCGNGGSAADCQHMAAEFVSRLTKDFERPALPAIALTTDTSLLTAFANDCGFEGVFERQVQALGRPGDVLIGISTSGNSLNVVRALEAAQKADMRTVVLTGSGGRLTELANVTISVPSVNTQYIQEAHLAIEHTLCYLVERCLFGDKDRWEDKRP
jgi:phosphoheptose isomerase